MLLEIIQLNENNYAPLYHCTASPYFVDIIKGNTLKGYTEQKINNKVYRGVSLTRDKHFSKKYCNGNIVFVLNQNLLRNNHKLIPYDYFYNSEGIPDRKEAEDFLVGDINNLRKYVTEILIGENGLEYLKSKQDNELFLDSLLKNFTVKDFRGKILSYEDFKAIDNFITPEIRQIERFLKRLTYGVNYSRYEKESSEDGFSYYIKLSDENGRKFSLTNFNTWLGVEGLNNIEKQQPSSGNTLVFKINGYYNDHKIPDLDRIIAIKYDEKYDTYNITIRKS